MTASNNNCDIALAVIAVVRSRMAAPPSPEQPGLARTTTGKVVTGQLLYGDLYAARSTAGPGLC